MVAHQLRFASRERAFFFLSQADYFESHPLPPETRSRATGIIDDAVR